MSVYPLFDRNQIKFKSVEERWSKLDIKTLAEEAYEQVSPLTLNYDPLGNDLLQSIETARANDKPVILCMGAHAIKNGACLLINDLVDKGYITHIASNGAAAIHDWEFARFGKSTECVRTNVAKGEFGIWQETGLFFGLAAECACEDKASWGEKIGELIQDGITFDAGSYQAKAYSVMVNCWNRGVPFTIHPGIGYDIVYSHPTVTGNIGCCLNDFLIFCESIRNLEGGVYLSMGSTVMSPMIFEKALSMSRNVEQQGGRDIQNFTIAVNDIAHSEWDWSKGEPPIDNPDYYLRWMKSFHRMGGKLQYHQIHNISFLKHLHTMLCDVSPSS